MQRCSILCLCILVVATLLAACHGDRQTGSVHFNRFERVLFDTPVDDLRSTLAHELPTYGSPLLNVEPDNDAYMQMLVGFVSDPVMRDIYRTTDSLYHDLGWMERTLQQALQRAHKLCPDIEYTQFYTLLTGDYQDYQHRVFCDEHALALSLDHYAIGHMPQYQYFGTPSYILSLCNREHMAADCMTAIARAHIALPDGDLTLLDYAIAEGKALYFAEQTLPHTADTLLLRYTAAQKRWMEEHVEQVWAWFIQNKLLYSSDIAKLRNLVDDAPKTNAFGDGSAPRTPAYIGWQIVRRYMKKSGSSMAALLEETDSRQILTTSGWRP